MKVFKAIILISLLAAAAAILALGPRARTQVPPGRVVINYWEKWSGIEGAQMQKIVDGFNDTVGKDKGIYVQYMSIDGVDQKVRLATAAGVPPELAGMWDAQLVQFAAAGALQPLDELAREKGLTRDYYKPVYYDTCRYQGHLYALPTTPGATALHWNKRLFHERAVQLRAAGCDPDRPPRTLQELDRYAEALNVWEVHDGHRTLRSAGYLPLEPGWYTWASGYWFGGHLVDQKTAAPSLLDPRNVDGFHWVQHFSQQLGSDSMSEFRSGLGGFNSTQNAFFTGDVAMILQGPWMANYIEKFKPEMNRVQWTKEEEHKLPREQRKENYEWGAAPFPSPLPSLQDVAFCPLDIITIPRGAKHQREAFEFLAYLSRQDVMERLCSMHCKNSPLAKVSADFVENHPNPYIDVFEKLARSPNAFGVPQNPLFPEIGQELDVATQRIYLLEQTPEQALGQAQARLMKRWDWFLARQQAHQLARQQ